jgi:alcohol dehydrogenase
MQALVCNGSGKEALEGRAEPTLHAPTDSVVRITKTTVCGTDLHILIIEA